MVMHDDYRKSSRARWLCILKTVIRLHAGYLCLLLFGGRRHLRLLLRIATAPVMLAAGPVQYHQGQWHQSYAPLFKLYLDEILECIWRDPRPEATGRGVSYTRSSQLHCHGYNGWEEVLYYTCSVNVRSRWCSIAERDLPHDVGTWKPSSDAYYAPRARLHRLFPNNSTYLIINSIATSQVCKAREDWSPKKFNSDIQRRPQARGPVRFQTRRRPWPWVRRLTRRRNGRRRAVVIPLLAQIGLDKRKSVSSTSFVTTMT